MKKTLGYSETSEFFLRIHRYDSEDELSYTLPVQNILAILIKQRDCQLCEITRKYLFVSAVSL